MKETFKLKDQGNRDLGLRYDLTVPFARFIGTNPQLKMPFKRYQIDKVWRDGPMGLGRYREFMQCDADVVGSKSVIVEAELLAIIQNVFEKLNLNAYVKVNNRKLLNAIIRTFCKTNDIEGIILSVDKLSKIGKEGVSKELSEKGIKDSGKLLLTLEKSDLKKLKETIKDPEGQAGIKELEDLFNFLKYFGVKNVVFEASLARGLAYYTGIVLEMFLKGSEINSAVGSGGRYDKMIGNFLGSKLEFPAVGISFGLDRIFDALKLAGKIELTKTTTKVYVIPIKTLKESVKITQELRDNNISADVDLMDRSISRNLEYANVLGIRFTVFVGEDELKKDSVKVRDMKTGQEKLVKRKDLVKFFKQ